MAAGRGRRATQPSHAPAATTTSSSSSSASAAQSPPASSASPPNAHVAGGSSPSPPASVWGKASNPFTAATAAPPHAHTANGVGPAETNRDSRTGGGKQLPKAASSASSSSSLPQSPQVSSPSSTTTSGSPAPPALAAGRSGVVPSAPSSSSASPSSSSFSSALQIGNVVRVTTVLHEVIEGAVYVYDAAASVLALEVRRQDGGRTNDYTLCNTQTITSTQLIRRHSPSASSPSSSPPRRLLPDIDVSKLAAKETRALSHRKLEASRIGVGVTVRGQRIFDALCKLYGAEWDGDAIVVMNAAMRLEAPYGPGELTGGSSQQRQRIVKTIEAQREKDEK